MLGDPSQGRQKKNAAKKEEGKKKAEKNQKKKAAAKIGSEGAKLLDDIVEED